MTLQHHQIEEDVRTKLNVFNTINTGFDYLEPHMLSIVLDNYGYLRNVLTLTNPDIDGDVPIH